MALAATPIIAVPASMTVRRDIPPVATNTDPCPGRIMGTERAAPAQAVHGAASSPTPDGEDELIFDGHGKPKK
jgi:hypothetical protein